MANMPEKVLENSIASFEFHSKILVVGGGADNTAIELLRNHKCDELTHVDISNVLSAKGKARLLNQFPESESSIEFMVKPFLDFESKRVFDAIIFPFYLDLFQDDEIIENIEKLKMHLHKNGAVYVIDFLSSSTKWQRFKEWGLYFLFQPLTKVNRRKFPEIEKLFVQCGFIQTQSKRFENGFYCSGKYVLE